MLKKFWFFLLNFNFYINRALAITEGESTSTTSTNGVTIKNPLQNDTIKEALEGIAQLIAKIAVPIVAIMILVGAYQILFSAGDPEKVKTGRRTILYTVIAYGIILIGWGIASIIKNLASST